MATPPKNAENEIGRDTATAASRIQSERDKAAVSESANEASGDINKLREDLSRLSNDVAALVGSHAGVARETARGYANDLYDQGISAVRSAEDQARQAADDLGRRIQDAPLQAVGIAFGIGYLLGFLKRGR